MRLDLRLATGSRMFYQLSKWLSRIQMDRSKGADSKKLWADN